MHTLIYNYWNWQCVLRPLDPHTHLTGCCASNRPCPLNRSHPTSRLEVAQAWILPVHRSWRGRLNSGYNPVTRLSLSKLPGKSLRSWICIQLQQYSKLLPHSKLRVVSQSQVPPSTWLGQCHWSSVGWLGAPLQQAARPGDDGQGDSASKLLKKTHQCRVGHSPRTLPVHLEQDVPTPAQRQKG